MQMKPFRKQREKVIPFASGRILEIGIGQSWINEDVELAKDEEERKFH